jgi:putative transposase
MATGSFAYTAFVIDAYADRIVGWECSTSKQTAFVESAIRQGRSAAVSGTSVTHSDADRSFSRRVLLGSPFLDQRGSNRFDMA